VSRVRILIAEGRSRVRFALRTLLQQHDGLDVVGEAADAKRLVALVHANCPDLVLLDWDLPGMVAANLIATVHDLCPGLAVIALSGRPSRRQAALAAGADAFLSKMDPPERLLEMIWGAKGETEWTEGS
jgi:DNA-binding NarL/FixJ family response regulator